MWWQLWWAWAVAGLVLGILEVLAPGYIFLGFAAGAVAVGLLLLVGGPFAAWVAGSLPLLLLIFALASLAAWLLFRRVFGIRAGQVKVWDRDINED
jgi:membrane protein implicated in regulation of membrane protease activity